MSTLKDQYEQEERLKKKIMLQKKNIQSEIDELKELADESEELAEEIEKYKGETESFQTELKNDIQREKKFKNCSRFFTYKNAKRITRYKKIS